MHLFIVKGMRGGISYIAKRYSEANDKYMRSYDAMSQYLPYSGFKWLNQK